MKKRRTNKRNKIPFYEKDIVSYRSQRKELWGIVDKYTGHPLLVDFSAKLIKKFDIPAKDEGALVRALHSFVQKYIRYFREQPERFASPLRVIAWGIGDCDCKSILLASMLRSFRIPCRLKILRFTMEGKKLAHVYPQAKLNGNWYSMETVMNWPIGRDVESILANKNLKYKIEYIGDK